MGDIIQLNQEEIKGQLKELVRGTVEETLNKLLDEKQTVSLTHIGMNAMMLVWIPAQDTTPVNC